MFIKTIIGSMISITDSHQTATATIENIFPAVKTLEMETYYRDEHNAPFVEASDFDLYLDGKRIPPTQNLAGHDADESFHLVFNPESYENRLNILRNCSAIVRDLGIFREGKNGEREEVGLGITVRDYLGKLK